MVKTCKRCEQIEAQLSAQGANYELALRIERATGYKDGYTAGLAKRPLDDRVAYQRGRSAPAKMIAKLRARCDAMTLKNAELEAHCDVSRQIINEQTDRAEKAEAQLVALTESQARVTWQPIETAPKDADLVLLYEEDSGVHAGFWYDNIDNKSGTFWLSTETQILTGGKMEPTHWMPLPTPPASAPPETKNDELTRRDRMAAQPPRSAASPDTKGSER